MTQNGTNERKNGDLIFLWDRDSHQGLSRSKAEFPSTPNAHATSEGASGIFLNFAMDPKKGKHTWRILVTLRNGSCVVWKLNARLFKRGWADDARGPVIDSCSEL